MGAGYLVPMEQKNTSEAGEGFDPSDQGGGGKAGNPWRAVLPADVGRAMRQAAKSAFAKVGMEGVGETAVAFAGGAPGAKTRSEAAKIVRQAKKAAVNHYSDPGNLAELGAKLTVLMSDYGHGSASSLGEAKLAEVEAGLQFGDEGEKAVYTKTMIDIYNGAVRNLHKAARKSGDRSFLSDGHGGEISEALVPVELEEAYTKATTRDWNYVWTLETDKDGRSRVVRKNAPTVRDWAGKTVDAMSSSPTMEEGIGYFLGSSLRAVFRLLPGVGEVEGKDQLRAEAARLYQQVEALIPSRKGNIHPHGTPAEREEAGGALSEEGGKGLAAGSSFKPGLTGIRTGNRDARHAGHG